MVTVRINVVAKGGASSPGFEEPFLFESRLQISIGASGLLGALTIRQNQTRQERRR